MPESSLFRWSCVPAFSGAACNPLQDSGTLAPLRTICPLSYTSTYTRTHIRAYIRARGFLDYKFLDITVIFRLPPYRNFWSTNGNF